MEWFSYVFALYTFVTFFVELLFFFLTQTGISCLHPLHVMGWFSYVFALYTFVTLFERCFSYVSALYTFVTFF